MRGHFVRSLNKTANRHLNIPVSFQFNYAKSSEDCIQHGAAVDLEGLCIKSLSALFSNIFRCFDQEKVVSTRSG